MHRRALFTALWLVLPNGMVSADDAYFKNHVAPILQQHCLNCHNDEKAEGGLSLATASTAMVGGDSGEVIVAGDPDSSYLVEQITPEDSTAAMPDGLPPLPQEKIDAIRKWIADGAHWPADLTLQQPQWWSLRPLVQPPLPTTAAGELLAENKWTRTPVDLFVYAKLKEMGLSPAPQADRRTLIRRLYYDLIGLPPTPDEADQFVTDPHPQAYELLVDRLLATPRYGERWARHWLDVVHYGETHGYDKDKLRLHAWPYRDYVIRSLNDDKLYTRFIQEQVAGDVMFPDTTDGIEALGFIAAGPWDHVGHAEVPETKIDGKVARHLDRDDMVRNTIMSFMSLTVGCAQCHDHKFDPITQEDYYSLHAVFAAVDRADQQYDDDPEVFRQRRELRNRGRKLQHTEYQLEKKLKDQKEDEKDEAQQNELAAVKEELNGIRATLKEMPKPKIAYIAMVHYGQGTFLGTGYQDGKPRTIHVLNRGEVTKPGEKVAPGTLRCIEGLNGRFDIPEDAPEGERRAALARWLTDTSNPLPWRSIVNRVWQYHFGRGIVETPNDFGRMGAEPTHPQLLDYLAAEFRDGGQSIKQLHRQIVNSATYRQSSQADPSVAEAARLVDADNRYYWRANRRRLEAEAIRDALLFVSGKLDFTMGGPSFQDFIIDKPEHSPHYEYYRHDPDDPKSHRRSVYRFLVRSQTQPFMTVMDCADPSMMVPKRSVTISPLQSLALLNNKLTLAMSKHFATRVAVDEDEQSDQISAAFRYAISRSPNDGELSMLTDYARRHGMENTCRVILNLNEFIFVD